MDKSNWKPNRVHQSLDIFQRSFKIGLLNSKTKTVHKSNLTKEQRMGLQALTDNPEIVIKKADKGSAVVVMNTTDYLREGYRQLSDIKYYTKLPDDPTDKIAQKVRDTLAQMRQKGLISDKNFEHLAPVDCTEARFYYLKFTKMVYQVDQVVVLSTTQLVELVNWLMNTSKNMFPKQSLTLEIPKTLLKI